MLISTHTDLRGGRGGRAFIAVYVLMPNTPPPMHVCTRQILYTRPRRLLKSNTRHKWSTLNGTRRSIARKSYEIHFKTQKERFALCWLVEPFLLGVFNLKGQYMPIWRHWAQDRASGLIILKERKLRISRYFNATTVKRYWLHSGIYTSSFLQVTEHTMTPDLIVRL